MATDIRSVLIVNSTSKKALRLAENYRLSQSNLELAFTSYSGHASKLAEQYIEDGFDLIIACGGDGTLNEVVQAFGKAEVEGRATPYFSFVPTGSANDFARNFKSKPTIDDILLRAQLGEHRRIDIGQMNGEFHQSFFLNIADFGLGAEVVDRVNRKKKTFGSDLTFLDAVTRSFIHAKRRHIELKTENDSWSGEALSLIIANGRSFGSGLVISPYAHPQSGFFNVVVIGNVNLLDYTRNLPRVSMGKVIKHPGVQYFKCRKIEVDTIDENRLEADGEPVNASVTSMSIMPGVLKLVY